MAAILKSWSLIIFMKSWIYPESSPLIKFFKMYNHFSAYKNFDHEMSILYTFWFSKLWGICQVSSAIKSRLRILLLDVNSLYMHHWHSKFRIFKNKWWKVCSLNCTPQLVSTHVCVYTVTQTWYYQTDMIISIISVWYSTFKH